MAEWSRLLLNQWTQDKGGQLEVVDGAERAVDADAFGLVQPDHRLGQGVVVGVADGADRGQRAGVGEPVGVADRGVLDCRRRSGGRRR